MKADIDTLGVFSSSLSCESGLVDVEYSSVEDYLLIRIRE